MMCTLVACRIHLSTKNFMHQVRYHAKLHLPPVWRFCGASGFLCHLVLSRYGEFHCFTTAITEKAWVRCNASHGICRSTIEHSRWFMLLSWSHKSFKCAVFSEDLPTTFSELWKRVTASVNSWPDSWLRHPCLPNHATVGERKVLSTFAAWSHAKRSPVSWNRCGALRSANAAKPLGRTRTSCWPAAMAPASGCSVERRKFHIEIQWIQEFWRIEKLKLILESHRKSP